MSTLLDGRVIAVTGASGGIGSSIVDRLGHHGAKVLAHRFRGEPTDRENVTWFQADLREPASAVALIEATTGAYGRIDGLVNNAALQHVVPFDALDGEPWQSMLDMNVTVVHRLTAAAVPAMPRGGSIVHIASIEALHPAVGHTHYAVSKAALVMHARAAALELGSEGIRVNAVSPGLVDRPGLAEQWPDGVERWTKRAPLQRLGTGSDVGDACTFLLSPMSSFVSGANLVVDGGMSACPTW